MKTLSSIEIEKIKGFFKIEFDEDLIIISTDNKRKGISFNDKPHFFLFGQPLPEIVKGMSWEEMKDIELPEGILKLTGEEIYYNLSPELYKMHLPDERTINLINKIKKQKGLINSSLTVEDTIIKDPDEKIKVWANSHEVSEVMLQKLKNNNWMAEYVVRDAIDSYSSISYIFAKKPNADDIKTIETIEEIQLHLYLYPQGVFFNCLECGKHSHWLDSEGDNFREKWNNFSNYSICQHC